jgi:urease accessory protein
MPPMTMAVRDAGVFAANRAVGRVALTVVPGGHASRRTQVHEEGSLRVRFPGATPELEAVLVNTAGGMAGGDLFDVAVTLDAGARLVVTTAAAEKVYRSLGPDTQLSVRLRAGAGAALSWVPQETILFDRARLARAIEVDLAEDASLLVAEAVVFGRTAMGEAMEQGRFLDRWRVRRAGKLAFAETVGLDGGIAENLAESAVAAGGVALGTVLLAPGDNGDVAAVRALGFAGEVGASAWNGVALVRLCAKDGAALRHDLVRVLAAVKRCALPRLWLN